MTSASSLTPHAALGWLRSLSIDITAAAVLDATGAVLAGDAALAGEGATSGQSALGAAASSRTATGAPPGLISARSERHAIVLRIGPRALERLVRADLQAALEALESR
jgi:hypothetical protein